MRLFDAVWAMYLDFVFAAELAHQDAISLINQYKFAEAKQKAQSRDGYYDCAMQAIALL